MGLSRTAVLRRVPLGLRFSKAGRHQRRTARQHARWLVAGGKIPRDGKFVEGREGWLFMTADSNDVLRQHTGERMLTPGDLARWSSILEQRVSLLAERDCRYVMLVAPDTHAVYPEFLPPGLHRARDRPVHQLMHVAQQLDPPASVVYPLEQMLAQKEKRPVCSPIDSHWTDFGAYIAYTAVVDELAGVVRARRLAAPEVAFQDMISAGDLGVKIDPVRLGASPVGIVRYPGARLLFDNCVENIGSILVTECRAAPPTTCLLLGDSYAYSFVKYIAESFGRVVLVHSPGLDWNLVDQIEPDVVLCQMAERFLVEVPEDGQDLGTLERWKRVNRRTRPPQTSWWAKRWPSPIDVERLRAHLVAAGEEQGAAIVSLLGYGGLVAQEITALRWADVRERELAIRRPGRRIGEAVPARLVPMIAPLAEDLRRWKERQGPPSPRSLVFPDRDDQPWGGGTWASWRKEIFDPAVAACGLDLESPLDLRDAFSTLLINQRMPEREIARLIGERTREVKHLYRLPLDSAKSWEPVDAASLVRCARRAIAERELPAPLGA